MDLPANRAAAYSLLQRYTTLPPSRALALLQPAGLQLSGGIVQRITEEQILALLDAAKLTPAGPHVEAAWREIEGGLPWPPPRPAPKTAAPAAASDAKPESPAKPA